MVKLLRTKKNHCALHLDRYNLDSVNDLDQATAFSISISTDERSSIHSQVP
jgi:hypothetical protein